MFINLNQQIHAVEAINGTQNGNLTSDSTQNVDAFSAVLDSVATLEAPQPVNPITIESKQTPSNLTNFAAPHTFQKVVEVAQNVSGPLQSESQPSVASKLAISTQSGAAVFSETGSVTVQQNVRMAAPIASDTEPAEKPMLNQQERTIVGSAKGQDTMETKPPLLIGAAVAKPLHKVTGEIESKLKSSEQGAGVPSKSQAVSQPSQSLDFAAKEHGRQLTDSTTQHNSPNTVGQNSTPRMGEGLPIAERLNSKNDQSHNAPRASAAINSNDVAVQMARPRGDGSNQFTIRLSPENLGKVTVKLEIRENARISANLLVEKPETLALMRKDLAALEKSLRAQGFLTKDGDISLSLKAADTAVRSAGVPTDAAFEQRSGQSQQNQQPQTQVNQSSNNSNTQTNSGSSTSTSNTPLNTNERVNGSAPQLTTDMSGFQQSAQDRGTNSNEGSLSEVQQYAEDDELGQLQQEEQDYLETIAAAYHARNTMVGISSQIDLSI